ncbi:MAG: aspartate aminotransferase family protein [Candidatus Thorarchaeota archaeon]
MVNNENWTDRDQRACARKYRFPSLIITESDGVYLKDNKGNKYLDFTSGGQTSNLGHGSKTILEAVEQQLHRTGFSSFSWTLNPTRIELAEKLLKLAPGTLSHGKVGFCNTGSDATELVMRMAKQYSKKPLVICYFGCFHGQTSLGSLALNTSPHGRTYGVSEVPGIMHVPYPYCYRCQFGKTYPDCEFECLDFISYQFDTRVIPPESVAVIFIEPVQVHGGVIPLPDGYLDRLAGLCRNHGILLAIDEVTTGIGRTGKMFAIEHWNAQVDFLYLAKSIASGLSLGAIIGNSAVMENFKGGGTFSGNPAACAASLANIEAIQSRELLDNVRKTGMYLVERIREIKDSHPIIGDIRGLGLLIGVELVEDKKKPARNLTKNIIDQMAKMGLLMFPAGVYQNVLRFCPPLITEKTDIDKAIEILEVTLR